MFEGILYGLLMYKLINDSESLNLVRKLFSTFGYGYIDLLRMIVIPLVPTSIIVSFLKLEDSNKLKKLGFRTIGMFLTTASIASVIGIIVATMMNLGKNIATTGIVYTGNSSTVTDVFGSIRGFIPKSPVQAMADLNLVAVIVFALFIAISAVSVQSENKEKVAPFRGLLESFLAIVNKLTQFVIKFTPYGVLGLTSYWFSYEKGLNSISVLIMFIIAIIIACTIQLLFTYGGIMFFVNKVSIFKFIKKAYPAMLLAFTSRSSAGTLTVTVDTCKNKLKVSEGVSNFVAPLGAVMNMDACGGLYPAIGLPLDVIAIVAGVDFIVDMFRTSINVRTCFRYLDHIVNKFLTFFLLIFRTD